MKKKILSLVVAILMVITLASCKKTSYNQSVPYGSLDETVYAEAKGNSISNKKLYEITKASQYETLKGMLKDQLFSDITSNTKYFDYENNDEDQETINQKVVNAIYSVNSHESFKKLTAENKDTQVKKYVNSLFEKNITKENGEYFTEEDIKNIAISLEKNEDKEEIFVANFPYELYKEYILTIALEKYALEQLQDENFKYYYKNEYIPEEGKNSYYIDLDHDIQHYYYEHGKNYLDYKGIIIKFTSLAQAERILKSANGGSLEIASENALSTYIDIYNLRYTTRDHLSLTEDKYLEDSYVDLSVTKESNKLEKYSEQVATTFKNMEDGDYLSTLRNIDGSYYLIYRISGEEVVEWDNLTEDQRNPEVENSVYNEMLDYVLENKNTSLLQDEIVKIRYNEIMENLEVYDPVFEYKFASDYKDDYTRISPADYKNSDNGKYIYKYTFNDKEYTLAVDDFYNKIIDSVGMDKAVSYLINEYVLDLKTLTDLIDSDDVTTYRNSINSAVKSFNKGKTSYSKYIGLETYLQLNYGFSTVDDVVNNYKAGLALTEFKNYFGTHTALNSQEFDVTDKLFNNFAKIYEGIYKDYFSASISHILIGVDEEGSGEYVDPDYYRSSLITEELRLDFDSTILNIANAIISEVKVLTISKTVKESLDYIVTAFNNNYKINSLSYETGADVYWYDLRSEFPISLKAEDLNEINNSNAGTYVEEFSVVAKDLYNKVINDEIKEEDVEENGVFQFSEKQVSLDNLCKTVYGYHILNIYDITEQTSAKYQASEDSKADDDDEYKLYERLEIIVEPDGDDEDDKPDLIVYTNGYSDNDYASVNQLFAYFYEYINKGSSTSLKSTVSSSISKIFNGMIDMYKKDTFVNWRMVNCQLTDLKFAGDTDSYKLNRYKEILDSELFNYTVSDYTLYTDWIEGSYDWTITIE